MKASLVSRWIPGLLAVAMFMSLLIGTHTVPSSEGATLTQSVGQYAPGDFSSASSPGGRTFQMHWIFARVNDATGAFGHYFAQLGSDGKVTRKFLYGGGVCTVATEVAETTSWFIAGDGSIRFGDGSAGRIVFSQTGIEIHDVVNGTFQVDLYSQALPYYWQFNTTDNGLYRSMHGNIFSGVVNGTTVGGLVGSDIFWGDKDLFQTTTFVDRDYDWLYFRSGSSYGALLEIKVPGGDPLRGGMVADTVAGSAYTTGAWAVYAGGSTCGALGTPTPVIMTDGVTTYSFPANRLILVSPDASNPNFWWVDVNQSGFTAWWEHSIR